MAKFRVHFEASAAIGIEIEIEAETEQQAERMGERLLREGKLGLDEAADAIFHVHPEFLHGFNTDREHKITYAVASPEEHSFELIDVMLPEDVERDQKEGD